MILIKQDNGSYVPAYKSDHELSGKIKAGAQVYAAKARNPHFHRKGMGLLRLGFENQDKFEYFEIYRGWVTMKAGFAHYYMEDGVERCMPRSIAFQNMNNEEFEEWYNAVKTVVAAEAKISGADIEGEIENFY